MPIRYNVSPYPQVVNHSELAVMPGSSYEFTVEQAAGLSVVDWAAVDEPEVEAVILAECPDLTEPNKSSKKPRRDTSDVDETAPAADQEPLSEEDK